MTISREYFYRRFKCIRQNMQEQMTRKANAEGFSWEEVEKTMRLPARQREDLAREWKLYYAGVAARPEQPDVGLFYEWSTYVNACREVERWAPFKPETINKLEYEL